MVLHRGKTIHNPAYNRLISRLKARRKELGLHQSDVALELGVSRSWVSKTELIDRRLDILEARDLCRLYGMDLKDAERILGEDGAG